MRKLLRNNGLSIAMFTLFLVFFLGQSVTGWHEYNQDQKQHSAPEVTLREYLATAHFGEAIMENWESEFLQMGLYVLLTAFLFQKGSAESKSLSEANSVDEDPLKNKKKNSPWPVRRGGWVLELYKHSLSLALLALFLFYFLLHARFGASAFNEEQAQHGIGQRVSTWGYMATSRFWFESFQNRQSEFLSVGAVVILSIFLRQYGSPESKPVAMPHSDQDAA